MWMKDCGSHYEYILVYSDDLLIVSKNTKAVVAQLSQKYSLKGFSFPDYYIGGDYSQTKNEKGEKVSYLSAKTFVKNVCAKIEMTFNMKLKPSNVPFDPDYHPETDDSPLLSAGDRSKYRMLIGSALWGIVLGRHDILYASCTLARYNAMPRQGHLAAALRIFGYLKNNPKACRVFDTRVPDLSSIQGAEHKWIQLYPGTKEEIPPDMTVPKMKAIKILSHFDVSFAPCLLTRRSATGLIIQLMSIDFSQEGEN